MSKKMTAFGSKFIQTAKAISKKRKELAEAVGMEAAGTVIRRYPRYPEFLTQQDVQMYG